MSGSSIIVSPEFASLLGYCAAFVREALAAIAGAGVGAGLGARLAFRHERSKATEDRQRAERAAAVDLANRRATAGNLAIFALSQMHNDLLLFRSQLLEVAQTSKAPWFWMPPLSVNPTGYYAISVDGLAFLFQSTRADAPIIPMKLKLEESRFRVLLETIQRRAEFHQSHLVPILERISSAFPNPDDLTDPKLRREVGERVYATLRNYYVDIKLLILRGIDSTENAAKELREILIAELQGESIIGFEVDKNSVSGGSPLMKARGEVGTEGDGHGA